MANTVLTRTPSSATNQKTFTYSVWFKRLVQGAESAIVCVGNNPSSSMFMIRFDPDTINIYGHSSNPNITTHRKFYDPSAWYHLVLAVDTTQSTEADRVKLYINGVQETSFSTASYPGQNDNLLVNSTTQINIGERPDDNRHFEGYMSHFHFIDGTAYAASDFGSTDATTGEWTIKTSPSVTYGTNGFFILKDGNSVTDQSGNGNNFTVSQGTLTKSEDNPSNNFATFTVAQPNNSTTFSHGNTTLVSGSSQWNGAMTTIPLFKGKWYYECKYNTGGNLKLSVVGHQADYRNFKTLNSSYGEYHGNGYGYQFNNSGNDYLGNNNSSPNWGGGLSSNSGDKIFMVALDLDNGKIWYGADGVWFNDASGNTGNPSTGAHAHQTMTAQHLSEKPHVVTGSVEGSGQTGHWNFGNGYFGTTAVSSAGTNASNLGIFEYDVPTGFTAICTKGLNL